MGELEKLRTENRKMKLLLAAATELLSKSKELLAKTNRAPARKKKNPPKRRGRSM
jgi:hypothetical protein